MKSHSILAGFVMLAALFAARFCEKASAGAQPATQPAARALRVGVYDSRAVCIGGRNSPVIGQRMEELKKQLKDAEAAGDVKRADEIKKRGSTFQSVLHLQAFSDAPVNEFLAQIQDKLPAIAAEANVDVIVAKSDYHAAGVQLVDITDALVKAFNPDEKTLKTVAEIRKQPPLAMVDVLGGKD